MDKPARDARDEMNLATLPIALLGRNDTRETIEYYGTYYDGKKQQSMVWTVSGAANVGLPSEFAERVLVALLYLGSQTDFADRRLAFTPYQILKVLGQSFSGRNYQAVELALAQLKGVTVTSDKAWIEKKKDGSQKRVTSKRGFNIIDEFYLRSDDDGEDGEESSFIVWGSRIWKNLQAGYLRRLDIDFYYAIDLPLARRLFRFLDKTTNYRPGAPYEIDIFDLANKLGLAHYQYASHLKRTLSVAAKELVERGYLVSYEFFKTGQYTRVKFCRRQAEQLPLFDTIDKTIQEPSEPDPLADLWAGVIASVPKLAGTRLLSIEDGVATVSAGFFRDWIQNRLGKRILQELQQEAEQIASVVFVE
jgi:hypothetical protein